MVLKLRPHHLLCLPRFKGEGYDPAFIERAIRLTEKLKTPGTTIILVGGADDLCDKCPHMVDCSGGNVHKLARDLDSIVLDATRLELSKEMPAEVALNAVSEALPSVEVVCMGCQWLDTCMTIERQSYAGDGI